VSYLKECVSSESINAWTIVKNFDKKCTDSEFDLLKLPKLVYFYQLCQQLLVEMEIEHYYAQHSFKFLSNIRNYENKLFF